MGSSLNKSVHQRILHKNVCKNLLLGRSFFFDGVVDNMKTLLPLMVLLLPKSSCSFWMLSMMTFAIVMYQILTLVLDVSLSDTIARVHLDLNVEVSFRFAFLLLHKNLDPYHPPPTYYHISIYFMLCRTSFLFATTPTLWYLLHYFVELTINSISTYINSLFLLRLEKCVYCLCN